MNETNPIRRVSVVSTGQVQIRPDHVASTWRPTAVWLLASRTWTENSVNRESSGPRCRVKRCGTVPRPR
jgi:hypothetical protein